MESGKSFPVFKKGKKEDLDNYSKNNIKNNRETCPQAAVCFFVQLQAFTPISVRVPQISFLRDISYPFIK